MAGTPFATMGQAGMITRTGSCHTFDAAADDHLRGEGCGALVLKRMNEVLADDDRVQAMIRGDLAASQETL